MKKMAALFTVIGLLMLSGCNTVQGMGQDVQRAGGAIERAAR